MAKTVKNLSSNSTSNIPVVTVLGHVDHGKTSLLDAIRKTNIAKGEHGGITQKIGASQVEVVHENQKRKITFIDTPGHEAFIKMRGRGTKVADIGLLVVSSVDGVMPQTIESIKILKESKIPYIVVLTKSDLADKNVEKIKGQLLKEEVMLEGKGGDVPLIEVSAKTGENIKELLDLIILVSDLHPISKDPEFKGVVIESNLSSRTGPKATVVIKGGKLSLRDEIFSDETPARVRNIINDKGEQVKEAEAGDAVEVLGFEKVPAVGSLVYRAGSLPTLRDDARQALDAEHKLTRSLSESLPLSSVDTQSQSVPAFNSPASGQPSVSDMLKVILVADSHGSLEAISGLVANKVLIVSQKTGHVEQSDILFAKGVGAIILSFGVKLKKIVEKMAQEEKVLLRNYNLIYEMIDEIEDFLEGKRLSLETKILGRAKILASFPFDKKKILGIGVLEGRVAKGDRVKVERDENLVGEGTVVSLRQGSDQISKAEKGTEAGILLSNEFDFRVGDMVISQG